MKLSDLTTHAGEWLRGSGPMSDVVISSRIRLARNISAFPFLVKCTRPQRAALEAKAKAAVLAAQVVSSRLYYFDLEDTVELDRQLLMERHLISKQHKDSEGARGVAVDENET